MVWRDIVIGLRRAPLSRKLCELFGWTQPNGQLKDMTCRVALLRMQAEGLISLPPSRMRRGRSRPHFPPTAATEPQAALQQPVHELAPVTLRRLEHSAASRLWNEYMQRYPTWAMHRCRAVSCANPSARCCAN